MNEKIIISNFTSMKHVTLDINKINIIIGPQATGKSVCAKLLFYFKSVLPEIVNTVITERSKHEMDEKLKHTFNNYFPPNSLNNSSFDIEYKINEHYIKIFKKVNGKLTIEYSDIYKELLNKTRVYHKNIIKKMSESNEIDSDDIEMETRHHFNSLVQKEIDPIASFTQNFIPAGRSFFANLQSSIFSFLSTNNALDPFLIQFGSFYERVKSFSRYPRRIKPKDLTNIEKIDNISNIILNGKYVFDKGKDYLLLNDNRQIDISNASSGQQETLPLALIFRFLQYVRFVSGTTLYIEEPEAHLFPTAQRYIVELIATIFNSSSNNYQFFITTHSPYILSSFNNLIYANEIKNKLNEDNQVKLYNIISNDKLLDGNSINSYSIDKGSNALLTCEDSKLISTNIIDEVSNILASQMEKLLEFEYNE